VFPTVLRKVYNLPMKLVTGYAGGGADINLGNGARRSRCRCGWSYSSMLSQSKALVEGKKITS
jgi:hypothetical protein